MLTAHTADVHADSEGTINDNRSAMDEGLYGTRVCQFWAECFTGSLVALPVLAASPPAVPLLPLTHRWRGGGRPPPALVTIAMPIAPSIRLPLGWPPDGVLACHPYARRGGERDGRVPTPPRGAYARHGQRDGLVVTAARHGGVLRRPRHPPQGPWS